MGVPITSAIRIGVFWASILGSLINGNYQTHSRFHFAFHLRTRSEETSDKAIANRTDGFLCLPVSQHPKVEHGMPGPGQGADRCEGAPKPKSPASVVCSWTEIRSGHVAGKLA